MALSITEDQYAIAKSYADAGDYVGGWNYLASIGDNYADDAYAVTSGNATGVIDLGLQILVQKHWENTVGETAYATKFEDVARQHFIQYVNDIDPQNGYALPTSAQIERSYRDAVVDNGLPPETAFDGVFTNSVGDAADAFWPGPKSGGIDWTDVLRMEDERQTQSDVFDDIDNTQAWGYLWKDMWGTVQELASRGLSEAAQAWQDMLNDAGMASLARSLGNVMDSLRDLFSEAETTYSPIILDLDGDGVETLSVGDGVNFDHNSNGFAERTGWVGTDDGLLSWDRNSDGTINNGTELFGNETLLGDGSKAGNGFLALSELDTNTDGRIDANDTGWGDLLVWKDANSDGISSAQELLTLDQIGIQSLSTGYFNQNVLDAAGNYHKQVGSFTWADGTAGVATDVWFSTDQMYTVPTETVTVPLDIAVLPDIPGYGNVYSLHQAMARDASGQLQSLVESFATLTTTAERDSVMEEILFKWAGVEGIDPNSRGGAFDARRLTTLERFLGEGFVGLTGSNPGGGPSVVLAEVYQGLSDFMRGQLATQTVLRSYYDLITFTWNDVAHSMEGDLSAVASAIQTQIDADAMGGRMLLGEFSRSIQDLGLQALTNYAMFRESLTTASDELRRIVDTGGRVLVTGTNTQDSLTITNADKIIYVGDGDDTVDVSSESSIVHGGAGNDTVTVAYNSRNTIYGEGGDDLLQSDRASNAYASNYGNTFVGGVGNDRMVGHTGSDTYIFNRGDGQDTISDYSGGSNTTDVVLFGPGIVVEDISARRDGNHVIVMIADPGNPAANDQITFEYWTASAYTYRIESFVFEDGRSLGIADVNRLVLTGTEGADTLTGWANEDLTLDGRDGDDIIQAANFNDTIYGGAGDDFIDAGNGNDTLDGEDGADEMVGGYGNDIYFVDNAGDIVTELSGQGADTVNSAISYTLGANVEHLTLTGSDVIDGTGNTQSNILTGNDAANVLIGDAGNDTLRGMSGDDTLYGGTGNDVIETGYGFDYAYGGADNDTIVGGDNVAGGWAPEYLYGEDGDDLIQGGGKYAQLYGGTGNDELRGGSGYQTLYGQDGDDTLIAGANTYLLDGGAGADRMVGSGYSNTFVVDNVADVIVEMPGGGIDTVNSSISYALADDLENLTLIGTEAISGTGNDRNNTLNGSQNAAPNVLTGGLGDDIYVVDAGDMIIELSGEGTDSVSVATSYVLGENLENLMLTGSATVNGTGNALDNRLVGNNANNVLNGGDGSDYLSGMYGNDTLNGGAGADEMLGGYGNDVYYVDDAGDVVTELSGQGTDTVNSSISYVLGANVERLTLTGGDAIDGTGNTLSNILTGNTAANLLSGNSGNDTLNGGSGDDVLIGGLGNDRLVGGRGSDLYRFARGDGQDTVSDYNAQDADPVTYGATTDVVELGQDIAHDQLWFSRFGDNLQVQVIGTGDQVVVENWYLGEAYQIEEFHAGDGYSLLNEQVEQLVQAMAAFAPPASGEMTLPESYRTDLDPILAANWQAA